MEEISVFINGNGKIAITNGDNGEVIQFNVCQADIVADLILKVKK